VSASIWFSALAGIVGLPRPSSLTSLEAVYSYVDNLLADSEQSSRIIMKFFGAKSTYPKISVKERLAAGKKTSRESPEILTR